jgi:hypothetical protein
LGEKDCYWNEKEKEFVPYFMATIFDIEGQAHWEMVENASFVLPCHLIEFYVSDN